MAAPSLGEWVGFIKSLTSDLNPLRLEARLASQRAVLREALVRSGRTVEAEDFDRAAAAWSLARVSIDELGKAGEAVEANRAAHGPRRDLSPAGMMAAEAAAAEMLLEQKPSSRTARAGRALLGRADKLLAAMEKRLQAGIDALEPFVEKYADPNGERAVMYRSLVEGWRQDRETMATLRAGLLAAPLDRERIARLRHGEALVARLFKDGMLTDVGLKARIAQARSLLANEHKPVRRIRARGQIVLAELVDVWDPRWADAVADSDRYLGDIGHGRDSMLLNPPGRGLPKPRPFRADEAAAETRWLAWSGRTAEAVRALCFYAPRLARADTVDPRWLALAVELDQPAIAARLAVEGLVAANAAGGDNDRRIDRVGGLAVRADSDAFAAAVQAQGSRTPERGAAAAFLLCCLGRPEAALAMVDEAEDQTDCGGLFFRLTRAFGPPGGLGTGAILASNARAAEWARALPSLGDRRIRLVDAAPAPGEVEIAAARAGAEALARALAQFDVTPAAGVLDGRFADALAGRLAAVRAARPGPDARVAAVVLGIDRDDDGLLASWFAASGPTVFGPGASAARIHRLATDRSAVRAGRTGGGSRRDALVRASHEAFRIGAGEPSALAPVFDPFAFEAVWCRLLEPDVITAVLDGLVVDSPAVRSALYAGLAGFTARTIATVQRPGGGIIVSDLAAACAVAQDRLSPPAAFARALRGVPAALETDDPVFAARYAGIAGLEIRPVPRRAPRRAIRAGAE